MHQAHRVLSIRTHLKQHEGVLSSQGKSAMNRRKARMTSGDPSGQGDWKKGHRNPPRVSRKRSHLDTAETEDTYNLQHYVEDHPPFTRPKISVETALDAVADESQETDRLLDPVEQRYEVVTEMPETLGQRGAKRRSDEKKHEDTEASESRT